MLGGGITAGPPTGPYPDLGAAADRVWHAARLYHAGKAPRLILSGGRMAWQGERLSEADALRRFLTDLGVPAATLLSEDRSRSTRENARYSAELLQAHGFRRVLLVTSALHMPRALATFRAAGVDAIPAPTDFEVLPEPFHPLRWLPDAQAHADSTGPERVSGAMGLPLARLGKCETDRLGCRLRTTAGQRLGRTGAVSDLAGGGIAEGLTF